MNFRTQVRIKKIGACFRVFWVCFSCFWGVFSCLGGCFRAVRLSISRVARFCFVLFFSLFFRNGAEQNGGLLPCLVVRCGGTTQTHIRGLCHWAGDSPPSHRAALEASRQARARQKTEPASSTPPPRAILNTPSEMPCPYAAVFRLSPPLVAHSFSHA